MKITKTDPTVKTLLQVGAPRYKGRTIHLQVYANDYQHNLASYWCEGHRDYHTLVSLTDFRTLPIPQNGTMFDREEIRTTLPENVAIVTHVFAGTAQYVRISVRQDNAAKLLTAAA